MSLLGRLEDLSLTDIIQIVFLSRRTGVLEIVDSRGRHTVLFRQGLVVNASSPEHPDLISYLHGRGAVPASAVKIIRQMEEKGISCGMAVAEMNMVAQHDLAELVRQRIIGVITPLLQSREGEFNFILSDSMNSIDIEYDPETLFREGGFAPQKIIGTADGEKIKPLRGLEESLKAGKALLRGNAPAGSASAAVDFGLSHAAASGESPENVLPFHKTEEERAGQPAGEPAGEPVRAPAAEAPPFALEAEGVPSSSSRYPRAVPPAGSGQFKVAGGLFEIESPEAAYRNVIIFERNPLVRVAARRAFGKHGVKIFQYGSLDDVRGSMTELFRSSSFFVTFLEITDDDSAFRLMQQVKRRNPRLPVVMIDREANLRLRHDLLRSGADLYLTKPSSARLQPGLVEEELALFADELVLFAERSFAQWEEMTGSFGQDAGRRFYEIAQKENLDRSFGVLKQLINELSNPEDINQVAATILRLSAEYLERGALFLAKESSFRGLGGFGVTGGGEEMDLRVRALEIPRGEPSVLDDVARSAESHKGKIRRTAANVRLIERMGGLLPTEVVVLPVMHGGRAIGILYGDNAEHRAPIDNMTGLEIFLSQAGYAFGNAVLASVGQGREDV